MSEASVKMTIHAPADAVWKTISEFGRLERFIPAIASCRVEGSGVGATRTLAMQDGVPVTERLEALRDEDRTLQYSILESTLPFDGYLATMRVRVVDDSTCEVQWSATFEPSGIPEAEAIAMLEGLYRGGIEGLEKLCGN
ncbi:MAG: hypothetical protein A2V70_20600 [Planctomycetes bacterium RBG_13_63_9]|nr:MAG: hypothetical protein A2V70_20600 [Planctomycetes bacterium RBG_13_63_9]